MIGLHLNRFQILNLLMDMNFVHQTQDIGLMLNWNHKET